METENYEQIRDIADEDVSVLRDKGKHYGRSWMKRGGVGAMMMLARKWDRIEMIVARHGWDIFEAGVKNDGDIQDDIADLRRYLLLVQSEIDTLEAERAKQPDFGLDVSVICEEPGPSYIDPDRDQKMGVSMGPEGAGGTG